MEPVPPPFDKSVLSFPTIDAVKGTTAVVKFVLLLYPTGFLSRIKPVQLNKEKEAFLFKCGTVKEKN